MFKIIKKDPQSWARTGLLETAHGPIETPAYVVVGTHGQVKCLSASLLPSAKVQAVIANTFHLWQDYRHPEKTIESLPKIHDLLGINLPMMTDSGGFQVFSLGFSREHGIGKIGNIFPEHQSAFKRQFAPEKNLVRITEEGVYFTTAQDREEFLGPELSIKIQEALGADIILAFDECTSPLHNYNYTREAMNRTHRWAKTCLQTRQNFAKQNLDGQTKTSRQLLYGIIQGGEFKDLRLTSAQFINQLPFDGIAIGGSLGKSKNNAFEILNWTIPLLEKNKPRHFLGIGKIEDIFESVEKGIDTFDCVIPTREARHGRIWTAQEYFDITKTLYKTSLAPLEPNCSCPVCGKITRGELHNLFKAKNKQAGQYATIHNVYFFNALMEKIRQAIKEEKLVEFKKAFLSAAKKSR